MRAFLMATALLVACSQPQPGDVDYDPFAEADASLPWQAAPPPAIAFSGLTSLRIGQANTLTITGDIANGERVYIGATRAGEGRGPCIPAAGGLCLGIRNPVVLLGSTVATTTGTASFTVTVPNTLPVGTQISLQAIIIRSMGGVDSIATEPVTVEANDGPAEGSVLNDWVQFDCNDDGYRDGCAGGTQYIKSLPYGDPGYVCVTRCADEREYKIWIGDSIYGDFYSAGDWSGSGEDQCEYVGGSFLSFPQGSNATDPNQPCWGRGPAGVAPLFEPACANNRWIAPVHRCTMPVPAISGGPTEGDVISDWLAFDFLDNGYRDGCAGGTKYVMSTPYSTARYVGVTLCSATTYKIWISDTLYGQFVSTGDWSGSGEDHCEYVGGSHVAFPQGSNATDPNQPCWGRGPAGVEPLYESTCASNRWIPAAQTCSVSIP